MHEQAPSSDARQNDPSVTPRVGNPWWIPPVLGRIPPEIQPAQLRLLGGVALALLFEHYDYSMLGSALKFIREEFGLAQSEAGWLTAWVRVGAVPAVLLVPFADRIGRRKLFLASVVGSSLATVLTAFTQSVEQFIAVQMLARTFLIAGSATAFVIVAEELPAGCRGWGIGVLGAVSSVGYGLGAGVFSQIDHLPYGWRGMYSIGVVPIALLPYLRRRVQETNRFLSLDSLADPASRLVRTLLAPLFDLARRYPGRLIGITLMGFFSSGAFGVTHQLMGDFLLSNRGWTPGEYSTMYVVGGAIGILGNTVVGRLGDRFGRRAVGFALFGGFPLAAAAFYRGHGWSIPALWIVIVFATTGGATLLRALATELFPTSARGTSTGWLMLLETLGAATALAAVSLLTPSGEGFAGVVSLIVFVALVAAGVVVALPETARRELESISE